MRTYSNQSLSPSYGATTSPHFVSDSRSTAIGEHQLHPAPPGWKAGIDPQTQGPCYTHELSNHTQSAFPGLMESGWKEAFTSEHGLYYVHTDGRTQQERPVLRPRTSYPSTATLLGNLRRNSTHAPDSPSSQSVSSTDTADELLEAMNEHWEEINASTENKLAYLQSKTNQASMSKLSEDGFKNAMDQARDMGLLTESIMNGPAACSKNAIVTGSTGASPCILGFVRATLQDGSQILASIHIDAGNSEHSMDPVEANDRILHPLETAIRKQGGENAATKEFYFIGGTPSSIDSCVGLAYAAEKRSLNIAACWMPANTEETFIDAMLTKPGHNNPRGNFYFSQGLES